MRAWADPCLNEPKRPCERSCQVFTIAATTARKMPQTQAIGALRCHPPPALARPITRWSHTVVRPRTLLSP